METPQNPGKKQGWEIPGKLTMYMWLGRARDKAEAIAGLPKGYERSSVAGSIPPVYIHYVEHHVSLGWRSSLGRGWA